MDLTTFKKLPLGGLDRRALVSALAEHGPRVATELLARHRAAIRPAGTAIARDAAVLVLGGSNGITRAIVLQLLFGEGAAVFGVHFDSERMQIGHHHVAALGKAAAESGRVARFWNEDATRPATVEAVVDALRGAFRVVHLVNGIAAGATKRYAEHGPTKVKDLDVVFDPVLQVPDFSRPENIRQLGLVDVEVATEADIERTNRFMGHSTMLWAEALATAGLLVKGESVVAFCDYDYAPDDPVYAKGPLAGAKLLQRESMSVIAERFGAKTARLCYPPVATTALGAIPGGLLMYALAEQIARERGVAQTLGDLAEGTMEIFRPSWDGEQIRLDLAYQAAVPEIRARQDLLGPADLPGAFGLLYG